MTIKSVRNSIKTVLKSYAKSFFLSFGYEIQAVNEKKPLPEIGHDLHQVWSKKNSGENILFQAPLDCCVTFNGFSFSKNRWHPFIATGNEYIESRSEVTYESSVLNKYYHKWKPENSLQALMSTNLKGPEILKKMPSYTLHNPWIEQSPKERQLLMKRIIETENRVAGFPYLYAEDGYGLHGPVTFQKGIIEFDRIIKLLNSIMKKGYDHRLASEDITGIALTYKNDFRIVIAHGQHRAAALSVLGYTHIPINLIKNMAFEDAEHWMSVYKGYWLIDQVQTYLDHLFTFDARGWAAKHGLI